MNEALVQQPARCIAFAETAWASLPYSTPIDDTTACNANMYGNIAMPSDAAGDMARCNVGRVAGATLSTDYTRHINGCNFLFVDGHVKYMERQSGLANSSEPGVGNWWYPWQP